MILNHSVLLLSLYCASVYCSDDECSKTRKHMNQQKLWDYVFCDYGSSNNIPVKDTNKAINVSVNLILKYFNYNDQSATFSVDAQLNTNWLDEYSKWDPNKFDGITELSISDAFLWKPDIYLYTKAESDISKTKDDDQIKGVLSHSGHVTINSWSIFKSICVPNLSKYPYDIQKCTLKFASRKYKVNELNLEFDNPAFSLKNIENNKNWKLISVEATKNMQEECCPILDLTFVIERISGNHFSTVIIPTLVLVVSTLILTWTSSTKEDKLYLCFFNIIVHFLYIQYISRIIPTFGEGMPNLFSFSRNSMFICILMFILTVIMKNLIKETANLPKWVSKIVSYFTGSRLGEIFFLEDANNDGGTINLNEGSIQTSTNELPKIAEWIIFEKMLNTLLLLIFVVVYAIMFSFVMI